MDGIPTACKDGGVGVNQRDNLPTRFQVDCRNQDAPDARVESTLNNLLAVGVEPFQIQVAMRVGERHQLGIAVVTCHAWPANRCPLRSQARDLQPVLQNRLDLVFVRGLTVNPDDGLGSTEADEHPAAVFELELVAVERNQARHFQPANCRGPGRQYSCLAVRAITFEGRVDPVVVVRANFLEQQLDQFRWPLPRPHHEIQQVQAGQNAIPFRHIATERITTTLFAADHRICFDHLGRYVLEAHAGLVHGHVVELAELIQHGAATRSPPRPTRSASTRRRSPPRGDYAKAIDAAQEALRLAEGEDTLAGLGKVVALSGDRTRARALYQRSLDRAGTGRRPVRRAALALLQWIDGDPAAAATVAPCLAGGSEAAVPERGACLFVAGVIDPARAAEIAGQLDALAAAATDVRPAYGAPRSLAALVRARAERAEEIQVALRSSQLQAPEVLSRAYGEVVRSAVAIVAEMTSQIDALERELEDRFEEHPDAEILRSLPGLGLVLGARVLAEFGDDPTRYADPKARKNYAGTSPITRASGRSKVALARFARNRRLADALQMWAFCSLSTSAGARRYYDAHRAKGHAHRRALRSLANRWVGILHGCLEHRVGYSEDVAWPTVEQAAA